MSRIGPRRPRRLCVWLVIAQQLVAGAGIVMPCPAAVARSAERFPCEQCGCGCQSAEQCWAHCCCFTAQQKVAWGRRNGVAVPEFVASAAEREAVPLRTTACRHCGGGHALRAGGPSHDARHRNDRDPKTDEDRSPGRVSWLDALRCHGLTPQWQTGWASWPGDRHVECNLVLLPRGRVESQPCSRYLFYSPAPPTPPPKVAYVETCDHSREQ